MNRLKIFAFLLFAASMCGVHLPAFGQSYSSSAAKLFRQGQYAEAVTLLDAALANEKTADKNILEGARRQAVTCRDLKQQADRLYGQNNFSEAMITYHKILELNKDDIYAQSRVLSCENMIAAADLRAAEQTLWRTAEAKNNLDAYREYLKIYPRGMYAQKARDIVKEYELWEATLEGNTEESFKQYLSESEMSLYEKVAQERLLQIEDEQIWQATDKAGTRESYTAYLDSESRGKQYEEHARASILLLDAFDNHRLGLYKEALAQFDGAAKVIPLTQAAQAARLDCREQVDYNLFITSLSAASGEAFLKNYPESSYRNEVSDALSRVYIDKANTTSISADWERARQYAVNPSTKQYVEGRIKEKEKARKAASRRYDWEERWLLGVGGDIDFWSKSFSYAGRVELRVGAVQDLFNFQLGAQYTRLSGWNEGGYHILADQIGIPAGVRFNFGYNRDNRLFIMAGARYNFNVKGKYKIMANEKSVEIMDFNGNELYPGNLTAFARFGWAVDEGWDGARFDLGLSFSYDASPTFNRTNIVEATDYYNDVIAKQLENRFRIGITFEYFFIL